MISFKTQFITPHTQLVWGFYYGEPHSRSKEDFENAVRGIFIQKPLNFIYAEQVHKNRIYQVSQQQYQYPDTDGLFTNLENTVLTIYTADCLPIIAYNPQNKFIGVAHAGWRGTQQKILLELAKQLKITDTPMEIDFLPHICGNCYTVGEEFYQYFPEESLITHNTRISFSLLKENERQLKENNIPYRLLSDISYPCSYEHIDIPSYRRKCHGRIFSFCFLLSPAP